MEYHNNVANGFSVQIDEEGNFSGIVQSCPAYKAGKEFSGNVHSLSMKEECIIDGILTECFDLRSKEGKAVYKALLNADDEEEVAEVATEEHEEETTMKEIEFFEDDGGKSSFVHNGKTYETDDFEFDGKYQVTENTWVSLFKHVDEDVHFIKRRVITYNEDKSNGKVEIKFFHE